MPMVRSRTALARKALPSVLAWLAGVVVAVSVDALALSLIGDGLTDPTVQPLTREGVARAMSGAPTPWSVPTPPSVEPTGAPATGPANPGSVTTPAPSSPEPPPVPQQPAYTVAPRPTDKLLVSTGGTVVARCAYGLVQLGTWSPAPGFEVDTDYPSDGSEATAEVDFKSDTLKVKVVVFCVGTDPHATVTEKADD